MAKKEKLPQGRPTIYSDRLATDICQRIAQGESLRSICRDKAMPAMSSVMLWLVDGDHQSFSEQYANARLIQAEILADELMDIADDGSNDWMERNGENSEGYQLNGEHVQRSRLRVDTRKWYLSKVLPKFADRKEIDHRSSDGSMSPQQLSDDDLDKKLQDKLNNVGK